MTVVPRQSMTTSARAALVRLPAPTAVIRPFSASNDSASPRGAVSTPVTSVPILTTPSVVTLTGLAEVGAHSYSPRQRSTTALARCQSYERNMRVFTTGCAAE